MSLTQLLNVSDSINSDQLALRQTRAWLVLVTVLALHVVDEAATHFLDFYNPW
jgi:hypothetical protein